MIENPHEIAKLLGEHEHATGVRAGPNRITVAHAPESRHTEVVPESLVEHILDVIEDTVWQPEGDSGHEYVEKHSWGAGVHQSPVLPVRSQPDGCELQYHLVR